MRRVRGRSTWELLGLYLAFSWLVLQLAQTLSEGLRLPDWLVPSTLVLLGIGLPVVLGSALVQSRLSTDSESVRATPTARANRSLVVSWTAAIQELHERSLWAVAGFYLAFSWLVIQVTQTLSEGLGLPSWVVPFALILLAVGFPVMLITAFVHKGLRRRAPEADAVGGWTWKRALWGGAAGFGGLTLVAIAWAVMRSLGIGPAGTLVAKGLLEERTVILLADFENQTDDPTLGSVVTEGLRVDLSQSEALRLADAGSIGLALARMERPPDERLTAELAHEVAQREGIEAVVNGEVARVGTGWTLTARVETPSDGAILVSHRETARDSTELLDAIQALSTRLRERIGEPLRSLAATPPLEQVTTSNLEALRRFSQSAQLPLAEHQRRIRLLEEAIEIDSTFAFAWRGLAIALQNYDVAPSRALGANTKAFELRRRLTAVERDRVEASYYSNVTREPRQAIPAYESAVARDPKAPGPKSNLGEAYRALGELETALEWYERALEIDSTLAIPLMNIAQVSFALHDFDRALDATERLERFGHFPFGPFHRAFFDASRGDYATAETTLAPLLEDLAGSPVILGLATRELAYATAPLGRLADYRERMDQTIELQIQAGIAPEALRLAVVAALVEALARGESERSGIDAALQRFPLADMDPIERPYLDLVDAYAQLGFPEVAKSLLAEFDDVTPQAFARGYRFRRNQAVGNIALAEGRHGDAVAAFRGSRVSPQAPWDLSGLARAFDAAGASDSARVYHDRYIEALQFRKMESDPLYLAAFLERSAELEEAAGNPRRAASRFAEFVELWRDADPELQPRVAAARAKMEAILARVG